jgi:hypothetical protein
MKYLIKDFDQIGKFLAVCGIEGIREKNIRDLPSSCYKTSF